MFKNLVGKFIEAAVSTLPISISVIIMSLFFKDITPPMYLLFSFGSILLIVGLALFSLGMDLALAPIGREIGSHIVNKKKVWLLILIPLIVGFIITIAEPGVTVLSSQLGGGNSNPIIVYTLAGAVGLFLLVSVLRIFLKIQLRYVFIGIYGLMLLLGAIAQIVNPDFVSVALDAGGVVTGAITVPFLMAFTVGISSVAHGRTDSEGDEGFGTVALCTAGPVIIILIIALSGGLKLQQAEVIHDTFINIDQIALAFGRGFINSFRDVAISLTPIIAIFVVFQIFALKLKRVKLIRIIIGLIYSYFGLSFFLTGVNVGFLPIGKLLGGIIALSSYKWILVPLGGILGALIVLAEPSVHALTKQVNELTSGVLSRRTMLVLLCIGVSLAVGMSLLRVLTSISIWWFLLPIYGACLVLTFFAPKLFTAIAFDSGGVASGPMTVTFALPFVIGACNAVDGNVFTDAFGIVASVTMAPILVIMITGVIYKVKVRKAELGSELEKLPEIPLPTLSSEPIIDFDTNVASNSSSSIIVDFDDEDTVDMPDNPTKEGLTNENDTSANPKEKELTDRKNISISPTKEGLTNENDTSASPKEKDLTDGKDISISPTKEDLSDEKDASASIKERDLTDRKDISISSKIEDLNDETDTTDNPEKEDLEEIISCNICPILGQNPDDLSKNDRNTISNDPSLSESFPIYTDNSIDQSNMVKLEEEQGLRKSEEANKQNEKIQNKTEHLEDDLEPKNIDLGLED